MKVSWDLKYGVYINNQSSSTIAKLRYGNYDSSYNGCGWIAVYNVLTFFGYNTHPAGIIKVLESQGALIDNGKYGTDFYALRLCFQAPSIRITEIGLFDLLMIDNLFRTKPSYKKALIVWIAFAFGMHYYTITYDSEYNVFRAYNCANDLGPVSSLLDIILNDGGAFVSAWYITYDTGFHW